MPSSVCPFHVAQCTQGLPTHHKWQDLLLSPGWLMFHCQTCHMFPVHSFIVSMSWLLGITLRWARSTRVSSQVLFSFPLDAHPEWDSQFLGQFCFKFGGRPPYHFYSGYTNLHSHPQCTRVPFSPNHCPPPQCLLSLVFLMITVLLCMWSWFAFTC